MSLTLPDPSTLTPSQRAAIREAVEREARVREARRSLVAWCEAAPPTIRGRFVASRWQRRLCEVLEEVSAEAAAGRAPRLIVCVPPQFGKSEIVSRRWPVWHLATHGGIVACASYGEDLALEHSRAAREMSASEEAHEVWPALRYTRRTGEGYRRNDVDLVSNWSTGNGGRYIAVGVGGPLTGKSPQLIIVDDPFKDREQADSKTVRERVWGWYTSVVYSRAAANGSGIVVMHTRWHEDDLVGRLLAAQERGGDRWRVVVLPCEAEADDPLGRAPGEPLDPDRMPAEVMAQTRRVIGERDWAALYQQRPAPAEGALFRRQWMEHRYTLPPREQARGCDRVWMAVDPNRRASESSDYAVVQVWGQRGALRMLLHQWRARASYTELRAVVRQLAEEWRPVAVLVEGSANGDALADDLAGVVDGLIRVPVRSTADRKVMAAKAVTPLWEAAQVLLPDGEPWVGVFREEAAAFPMGAHDDQVDTMTLALGWSREHEYDPVETSAGLSW